MLKDQIIALNLELDDKAKIEQLLKRKIELEKSYLSRIESEINERFDALTKEEVSLFDSNRVSLTAQSNELLEKKSELLKFCQSLVELIKEGERNLATEARMLMRETDEKIEQERKKFKQNFEDRLQKFLSAKTAEYRESTNRALQPEINRLESIHRQNLQDIETDFAAKERRIREDNQQRLAAMLEEEKVDADREVALTKKSLQVKHNKDLEYLNLEHKRIMHQEHEQDEREIEAVRAKIQEKCVKIRESQYEEMGTLQEQHQTQLVEAKRKNIQKLEELDAEHQQKLRQLKEDEAKAQEQLESELKYGIDDESDDDDDLYVGERTEDSDEIPRAPLSGRGMGKANHYSDKSISSPSKSLTSYDSHSHRSKRRLRLTRRLPPDLQQAIDEARRELILLRDKEIQQEIRNNEIDLMKLEKEWQRRAEAERNQVMTLYKKEEEQLDKQFQLVQDQISDSILERESCYKKLHSLTQEENKLDQEIDQLKKDIQIYQDGIAVRKQRMKEKEEEERLKLREVQLYYTPIIRDLKEQYQEIEKEMKVMEEQWLKEINALEKGHAAELSRLDSTVKSEVSKIDEQVAMLKEILDEELVKKSKLTAMLNHYTNPKEISEEAEQLSKVSKRSGSASRGIHSTRLAETVNADNQTVRTSHTATSHSTLRFGSATASLSNPTSKLARKAILSNALGQERPAAENKLAPAAQAAECSGGSGGMEFDGNANDTLSRLLSSLKNYRRQEADLQKELIHINESFSQIGMSQGPPIHKGQNESRGKDGIKMNSKLTFRGIDKVNEYFARIDQDNDGYLTYQELMAMHSFADGLGLSGGVAYQSEASWISTLTDQGIHVTPHNKSLDRSAFIHLRQHIEQEQELYRELQYLHMPPLPTYLQYWGRLKHYIQLNQMYKNERQGILSTAMSNLNISLNIDDAQFILANLGHSYTKGELMLLFFSAYQRRILRAQFLRVFSRYHLSEEDYCFQIDDHDKLVVKFHDPEENADGQSSDDLENVQNIPEKEFIVLTIATTNSSSSSASTNLLKLLLGWKYTAMSCLKQIDSYARWVFTFGAHVNDRLLFRDFPAIIKLKRSLQQLFTYRFSFNINTSAKRGGSMNGRGGEEVGGIGLQGFSANIKLMKVDTLENAIRKLNAPPGSGTVICVDISLQSPQENDRKNNELRYDSVRKQLHLFLAHHFEKELKNHNRHINILQVVLTKNDIDDSDILRIMLSYKKAVNIDRFTEYCLIPYKLPELINVLQCDLQTNLDLVDLCTHNQIQSLNDLFSCTFTGTITMRRNIIARLLERLQLAMCAVFMPETNKVEVRTKQGHASSNTSNQSSYSLELEDQREVRARQFQPFYATIATYCVKFGKALESLKSGVIRMSFPSLHEFYHYYMGEYFPNIKPAAHRSFQEKGYVRKVVLEHLDYLKQEAVTLAASLKSHLSEKKEYEDAKIWRQLIGLAPPVNNANPTETSNTLYEQALKAILAYHTQEKENEGLGIRLFDEMSRCIGSVMSMEILSGQNKLCCNFHGLDIGGVIRAGGIGVSKEPLLDDLESRKSSRKRAVRM